MDCFSLDAVEMLVSFHVAFIATKMCAGLHWGVQAIYNVLLSSVVISEKMYKVFILSGNSCKDTNAVLCPLQ